MDKYKKIEELEKRNMKISKEIYELICEKQKNVEKIEKILIGG